MSTLYDLINHWFLLSRETRPAGILQSRLHCHHSYEMFIPVNGSTTMLLDDKFISVSKYDIVLIKPDILHKNNGGTRHNRYAVHFTEEYLRAFFSEKASEYLLGIFECDKLTVTETAFNSVVELLRRTEKDEEHAYIHIAEIISILSDGNNIIQRRAEYANGTVNKITEYIHANYSDINGLDDIAGGLCISKPYMCHIFKQETDVTVSDYLNSVRINNACEILGKGKANITETAMLCGYNSSMYFCRVFKNIMGITPNEYKKYIKGTSKGNTVKKII